MNIIGTIVAVLILIGLIAFDVFVFIIGNIDKFIEELERKYDDR